MRVASREVSSPFRPRLLVLHMSVVLGCSASPVDDVPPFAVHDSAGIEIVVSRVTPETQRWRVASTPTWRIGTGKGGEGDHLYKVRGAVLLPDGRVAVANGGSWEVRIYSAAGEFLRTSGRRGHGPGEFQYLSSISRYRGDSLVVYDFRARRFSVLDSWGRYGRSFAMTGPDDQANYVGLAGAGSDGSMLMLTETPIVPSDRATVSRPIERVFRYTPDGSPDALVGSFAGQERYSGPGGAAGRRSFGTEMVIRVHEMLMFAGSTDSFEIGVYTLDGVLRKLIRKAHAYVPVQPRDIERDRNRLEREVARFTGFPDVIRRGQEALAENMPYPEFFPAFDDLRISTDRAMWVRAYLRPSATTATWYVFDGSGRLAALIELPATVTVHDTMDDLLLVGRSDSLGIEYVELHQLQDR